MALSAEQRESLNRAKLEALARSLFSDQPASPVSFPGGAMLAGDSITCVLLDADGDTPVPSVFGGALAKVTDISQLHVLVEGDDAATLARLVSTFDDGPTVWQIVGQDLAEAVADSPTPHSVEIPTDDPLVEQLRAGGTELVVEGGVVVGEILGLEVGRVGVDHDGEPRLHAGVGAYDQEAFAAINPEMTSAEGLANVVDEVRRYRRADAETHPINRLVRERWIRSVLIATPDLIGLRRLAAVPSFRPRAGLRDTVPATAVGTDADGQVVVAVCSTGADFGLIPAAADAITRYQPDRVLLVLPAKDQYRYLARNGMKLRVPTLIVDAPIPWG